MRHERLTRFRRPVSLDAVKSESEVRGPVSIEAKKQTRKLDSWLFLAAWYAISASFLLLLPHSRFGVSWWLLPRAQWLPGGSLAAAFLVSAGIAVLLGLANRKAKLPVAVACTVAAFGVVFLGLFLAKSDFSRAVTLTIFASAVVVNGAPLVIGPSRWQRGMALCALAVAAGVGLITIRPASEALGLGSKLINTEYYNLDENIYAGPKSLVHGGALGRIGNRYLLLTGDGQLYVFDLSAGNDGPKFTRLPYRVPINGDAFSAAAGRALATPPGEGVAAEGRSASGREILNSEWFRTYGLLVQEVGSDTRVFVSHDYWKADQQCWVERVSMLESDRATILGGASGPAWKTLYETTPCLPVRGERRRHGIPFVGYFGGGRMALLDSHTLLLTVGDFGFDGLASDVAQSQDPATSYGKTIAINIADGHATLFTLGHRNPQGLFIDDSGTVWSTEHGPQGGDELNRLVQGKNYGWPYATFGTDYGSFSWPLNKPESEQQGFEAPVFAWVPSIGVSDLVRVEQGLFPQWRGDLLIGSLRAQTLFRAHLHDGRLAYIEPIAIGSRIRDVIEGHDGRIVLWTDDDTLISLRPKPSATGEGLFAEKCSGCHQSAALSGNRIGPNLSGVVGRRIASLAYPDYSPCLRHLQGEWTDARLDAFLKDPHAVCPGTAMDIKGIANDAERASIIRYLGTL